MINIKKIRLLKVYVTYLLYGQIENVIRNFSWKTTFCLITKAQTFGFY